MTTVVCVLRSGGDFDARWVQRLARGVAEHTTAPHRFVCLSDVEVPGVECVPLRHDWPGWWAKLEVFRPGLFDADELVLYLDLDTLVLGDLAPFAAYPGTLALLSDFLRPQWPASGMMLWRPSCDTEAVYKAFVADPEGIMARNRTRMDYWLREMWPEAERIQERFPGRVQSFKAQCRRHRPAAPVSVVCGHGQPRFSDPAAGWAHEEWARKEAAGVDA